MSPPNSDSSVNVSAQWLSSDWTARDRTDMIIAPLAQRDSRCVAVQFVVNCYTTSSTTGVSRVSEIQLTSYSAKVRVEEAHIYQLLL